MRYNIITYLIGEGIRNVFKNKKSTGACIGTMIATMFVFGIFLAISQNIEHIMLNVQEAQGMQIFLEKNASDEEIEKVREELDKIEGINTIVIKSKDDALNQMKEMYAKNENGGKLIDTLNKDIFPVSYVITLTDLNLASTVKSQISQIEGVNEITSSEKTIDTLLKLGNGIKVFTGVILVILVVISMFIISNTIKLTVHARRKEISIMKYVGATNSFIKWPFMIEGMIIGVIAGIFSILITGGVYNFVSSKMVSSDFVAKLNISLLTFSDMFNLIVIVYLILGIGIGIVGSSMSMKKYLKV